MYLTRPCGNRNTKDNPQGICLWVVFCYFYGRNRYEQPDSYFGCRGGVLPAHRLPAADAGGAVRCLAVEDLLYALGKSLTGAGALRLGRCVLPLRDLRSEDHYWFAAPLPVRMVSPLTLHKSLPGGKTLFLRPDDDAFAAQLIANTAHKLAACRSTADPSVTLRPMGTRLPRKRVTQFKGIYLTGWEGDFLLDGDPETLCLLYQTGLGDRNSQGFGMFRMLL